MRTKNRTGTHSSSVTIYHSSSQFTNMAKQCSSERSVWFVPDVLIIQTIFPGGRLALSAVKVVTRYGQRGGGLITGYAVATLWAMLEAIRFTILTTQVLDASILLRCRFSYMSSTVRPTKETMDDWQHDSFYYATHCYILKAFKRQHSDIYRDILIT